MAFSEEEERKKKERKKEKYRQTERGEKSFISYKTHYIYIYIYIVSVYAIDGSS